MPSVILDVVTESVPSFAADIVPSANLIPVNSNYIIIGLQLPVGLNADLASTSAGTRIKYIGTHDKIPII